MSEQQDQLTTDVANLKQSVADLGNDIDTEIQNFQKQIADLKAAGSGTDISAQLTSLETSITNLQAISARAKAAGAPATA